MREVVTTIDLGTEYWEEADGHRQPAKDRDLEGPAAEHQSYKQSHTRSYLIHEQLVQHHHIQVAIRAKVGPNMSTPYA